MKESEAKLVDEHKEFVARMETYLACLETITKDAHEAHDFDAARETVIAQVKLLTSIQSIKAWFTSQEASSSVVERVVDKSLS